MQQNDKTRLWNKYATKVFSGALSPFDLSALLWKFGMLYHSVFFCVPSMLFHQCYINTVTQKPRNQDDEVTRSVTWLRPTDQTLRCITNVEILWDRDSLTQNATQLCLEQHLSIRRKSRGKDGRRCWRRKDRNITQTISHFISSASLECLMHMLSQSHLWRVMHELSMNGVHCFLETVESWSLHNVVDSC